MGGACLLAVDTSDDLGVISQGLLGVEGSLKISLLSKSVEKSTYVFASHALDNNSGVFVDENMGLLATSVDAARGACDKLARLSQSLLIQEQLGQHFIYKNYTARTAFLTLDLIGLFSSLIILFIGLANIINFDSLVGFGWIALVGIL